MTALGLVHVLSGISMPVVIRSRSSSRRREMRKVDGVTLKLFKSALRKSLEHNIVPFNVSLVRQTPPDGATCVCTLQREAHL